MLDSSNGLYVKAGRDIFNLLRQPQHAHLSCWVSFYEIYQGHLYDLLGNRKKLYAREDGKQQVVIKGIQEYEVDNVARLMQIFEAGNATRSTGATGANADSSRSHAIFQVLLKHRGKKDKVFSKLSFIDLAGSERGADRGETDKQTRMEGSEINKSLLALKECIRALDQDSRHTPFRQSKLTQVLKDSFIGVKELKGATSYDDDDDFANDAGLDYDDEEMKDDDDGLLIDDEFPPEAFQSDHHMDDDSDGLESHPIPHTKLTSSARSSLVSQSNKRPLLPRLSADSHSSSLANSSESLDLRGMATAINPRSDSFMEDLIKLHRSHIKDSTDSGKQESKLLVNLTMKMGKTSGDRSAMHLTFDNYVRELDDIIRQKMVGLAELQSKIQEHLNQ
ncbi:Kinesin-like protein kif24 [Kappamyces sp. JEL0680]|nr:Kinesin-like protein kif24 [Kappamyces sp. JEL0680]